MIKEKKIWVLFFVNSKKIKWAGCGNNSVKTHLNQVHDCKKFSLLIYTYGK